MRIAILLDTNVGGRWSVPSVAAMVKRGDDVLALLAREEGDLGQKYEAVGVEVHYHDFDKTGVRAVPRSWLDIRGDLRAFDPDVIVVLPVQGRPLRQNNRSQFEQAHGST